MDTKDEEPVNQVWARETTLLVIQVSSSLKRGPCTFHPEAGWGGTGVAVSRAPGGQFQEAAIAFMRHRGSFVLVLYLDVLMGYLELILRTPNYLTFVCRHLLHTLLWHAKTPPHRGSYRRSHVAGCLTLEPAQGPGLQSPRGPSGQWRLFKAQDVAVASATVNKSYCSAPSKQGCQRGRAITKCIWNQ